LPSQVVFFRAKSNLIILHHQIKGNKVASDKKENTKKEPIVKEKSKLQNDVFGTKTKTPFYFYFILFLIPIIFFVILELGLRIFNYGYDLTMWSEAAPGKTVLNPWVAKRYFTNVKTVPSSIEDIFDSEKAENTFRVFVLGESSAAGYPYMPMGSFSRYIRKRLELSYPDKKIEMINLALSATNSFTLRDFIPDILNEKPDLILIYAGHNEYYGALGVGSLESIGNSRTLVNAYLFAQRFKTTQLVRDFIQWILKLVSEDSVKSLTGTLMSRMAKDKQIELNSDIYKVGLEQFEENFSDIIEEINEAGVPLIISTMASNLRSQRPFISIKNNKLPPAEIIFEEASKEYELKNYSKADSLYRYAKDLDGLRFRAPELINKIIKKLGRQFNTSIIDVDSLFASLSPNGIIGDNLMTDHVHPTLEGFHEIGNLFYKKMIEKSFLPQGTPKLNLDEADKITRENFVFSKFDSTVAVYRIMLLKNDWPFIYPTQKKTYWQVFQPQNFADSNAVEFLLGDKSWSKTIEDVAEWYFERKNLSMFLQHFECLVYQYPIIVQYYEKLEILCTRFLKINDYNSSKKILKVLERVRPNAFSKKWIGQIALTEKRFKEAIDYLKQSIKYGPNDLQALYNLAGAYALDKQYENSYEAVTKVLAKDSNYPGARQLLSQLEMLTRNK
jgi:tetratricopeptide (TPR) repeat protein